MLRPLLVVLALLAVPSLGHAAGPLPPCDGRQPVPAYGGVDGAPVTAAWSSRDLQRERWQPPSCLDWQGESRLVVALAARFRSPFTLDQLAERITSVSKYNSVYYWAVTRQQWQPLAVEAWVTDGPDASMRRSDPPASALVPGRAFYYAEQGSMVGRIVYRVRTLEHTTDRLVLETENVTPITAVATLFEPGGLRIASFLTRQGDAWSLYGITRAGAQASSLAVTSSSPYLNRLDAMRRVLAGIKTDQEPPLAPL
jgi:uncharacterized protein DUF6675